MWMDVGGRLLAPRIDHIGADSQAFAQKLAEIAVSSCDPRSGVVMSEANKAVVRKVLDIYNGGAFDLMDDLIRPDYAHHNNDLTLSRDQFKRGAAWIRKGMPDFRIEIEDMVSEGDKVAIRFVGRGTHLGSMYGETPTSRSIAIHGETIYRLQDGMIVEDWEAMDEHDLMKQVGAVPPDA